MYFGLKLVYALSDESHGNEGESFQEHLHPQLVNVKGEGGSQAAYGWVGCGRPGQKAPNFSHTLPIALAFRFDGNHFLLIFVATVYCIFKMADM